MGWLEAMSIRGAQFGAHEVRLQIQAAYDAGVKSWALWNPGSKFAEFEDELRPAAGGMSKVEQRGLNVPPFTLSREKLSMVLRKRDQAAKLAAAAKAAGTAPPPSTAAEPNTPPSANDSGRQLKRR